MEATEVPPVSRPEPSSLLGHEDPGPRGVLTPRAEPTDTWSPSQKHGAYFSDYTSARQPAPEEVGASAGPTRAPPRPGPVLAPPPMAPPRPRSAPRPCPTAPPPAPPRPSRAPPRPHPAPRGRQPGGRPASRPSARTWAGVPESERCGELDRCPLFQLQGGGGVFAPPQAQPRSEESL